MSHCSRELDSRLAGHRNGARSIGKSATARRCTAVLLLTLLLPAASVVVWLVHGTLQAVAFPASPSPAFATISGPPGPIDLGEIWGRNTVDVELPLTNPGNEPLRCDLSTSCNCMNVEPSALLLEPGETATVKLIIRLPQPQGGRPEPFRATVLAQVHEQSVRNSWEIVGTARSVFEPEPRRVDFGNDLRVQGEPVQRTLLVKSASPLEGLTADIEDASFNCVVTPLDGARQSFQIDVEPKPALLQTHGAFSAQMRLLASTCDGTPLPPTLVDISGTVEHDVSAEPASAFLGARSVGDGIRHTVVLSSHRGEAFVVDQITTSSDNISVSEVNSPRHESPEMCAQRYLLSVRISQPGSIREYATFTVRDPIDVGAPYDVKVTVVAIGMPADNTFGHGQGGRL